MMTTKQLGPIQRPPKVAEEVEERLVLAIASGEQPAGSRLTEGGVAEAMHISRVPAREALLSLAAKGLLTTAGARGLKVADFAPRQARNVREVRIALESVAMRHLMAAARSDPEVLAPLDAVLKRMAALTKAKGNALAFAKCDLDFHRQIIIFPQNDVLTRSWEDLSPHLLVMFCKGWHAKPNSVGEVKLHEELRRFVANGEPSLIEARLLEHFALDADE